MLFTFNNRTVTRTVTLHSLTVKIELCVTDYFTANRPSISVFETKAVIGKKIMSLIFTRDSRMLRAS